MRRREGCGLAALGALFVVVGCSVFVTLAVALVLTGEVHVYAPRLTGLEPDPNFAFQPTTPFTLTFDQPMDRGSVEASLVLEPAVSGTFHWNETSTRVAFVPRGAGYEPGTTQNVQLKAGARGGTLPLETASSLEWSFVLPLLLEETVPPRGSEGLGPYPMIRARFGYPLDCDATSLMFSIIPASDGTVECEGYTLVYSPTAPFHAGTSYVALLEEVYLQGDPWPREGVRWEFSTAPALSIRDVYPPATESLDDLWARFFVTFNRPVLAESAESRFGLVGEDGVLLDGDLSWEDEGASLVFRPADPLRPSGTYRLTLQRGVQDELGFELSEALDLQYTTPPMAGAPSPAPGEMDVALDSFIQVPFLRPMDKASVETGLTIVPAQDGQVSWEEDTLVFAPRGGLAAETAYEVTVSPDVRDASGAPLAEPLRWAFFTQPFLLEAKVPSGSPLAELGQPLEFSFALPMDRASVAAALAISPTTSVELVWSDDSRSVALEPEPAWMPGVGYEITLEGTARTTDRQQSLGEDLSYGFSTAVSEVRFGEGPNLQVIGSEGSRTFQVVARGADVADFRLYAITETQFLDLYNPGFWVADVEEPRVLDTQGLTPTVEWREALAPLGAELSADWQQAEAHLPAEVKPGFYVLTGEPPSDERAQLLVVLTKHTLVLKRALFGYGEQAQAQVVVWDVAIDGGAPVVSATISLLDENGISLAQGITDADGLLTLEVPGDPGPIMALADKDGDVTVCGLTDEWLDPGSWLWSMEAPQPSRPQYLTYSYTDRPIYRPGQEVFFKHLIRTDDDASYALPPPDLPVSVRLRDGRDNIVASQVLTQTQYGTVHGAFELADEPTLGTWHIEAELEGVSTQLRFQVEEYRKPEYSVSVQTQQKTYVYGETISVTVDAGYYFGQPVAGGEVVLRAYAVNAEQLYADGMPYYEWSITVAEGQTDAQGRWTVALPTEELGDLPGEEGRNTLALEATVTDQTGQSVSGYELVVVQRAALGVTLVLEKHGYTPDEEIVLTAIALDRDGAPVPGAELVLRVLGWDGAETASVVSVTDADGRASFSVQLAEQGWYSLLVSSTEEGDQAFRTDEEVWIYDPSGVAPVYGGKWGEKGTLSIGADRAAYTVGDVAQLLIQAPMSGPALISLERGQVRQINPVELIAGTNAISVPIRADYAPNIHVAVSQFGLPGDPIWGQENQPETQLQTASTQLLVPMSELRLAVTLTADREVYSPGDEATLHVQVTNAQGEPRQAEVSLAIVDEAIYALAEDRSKDLFDVFYGSRPNLVWTFDSMSPLRWLYPEGFGGMGGDGELGQAPRSDFLDTALWVPVLVTDESGEATVTLELPDNLTEWRVLARAITTDTLVGGANAQLLVSQDIIIQPVVPRFLVQGDAVSLAAVIHNFTTEPVSATVRLELVGLVQDGESRQVVHVPALGSTTVAWPVLAGEAPAQVSGEAAEAGVTISATASRGARLVGRDAVSLFLPVYPLAVPEITTWAGELSPSAPTSAITLTLPSDVVAAASRMDIDLAPSLVSGLLDGLAYLIDYPYGCVEQTMSRILPNAMVSLAFGELGVRSELLETDLPPMIALGLQRLYAFQHVDGGWGWWYDDDTDANQTAYVLFGLATTERAGFEVDNGVVELGAEALRRMLPEADPRIQAYGAYSLVMAGQPVTVTLNLTDALQLDLFSQAALALALHLGGEDVVGPASPAEVVTLLQDNLRGAAVQENALVYWEESGDHAVYAREVMGSTERTTAMVLAALVRLDARDPLLPGAVRWLMARRQGQGWGDPQKTSYAIMALTDYQLASQAQAAGSAFTVYVNGELWQQGTLDPTDEPVRNTMALETLPPGENTVSLVLGEEGKAPSGRLYYAGEFFLNRSPGGEGIQPLSPHQRSIAVGREYRLMGSEEPTSELSQGDLVEVRLTLDAPVESWYVIVDDPLPAGFEALNERLGTESHIANADSGPAFRWEEYGYNRKEVRDERVTLFVKHLQPGQTTFTYLARAIHAGSFVALPAEVYPMYETEAWSRSAGTVCRVDAR